MTAVLAGGSFWGAGAPAEAADISALLTRAGAAEKAGDHATAVEALEQALESVRAEAPLTVKPFVVVSQPAKFYGDYTPRANAVFQGGEPQQFYLEPKNLVYPRTAAGSYEPAFDVDLQIMTAAGKVVTLSGAPPGEYSVRFVVRDVNSKKTATVIQPITLK